MYFKNEAHKTAFVHAAKKANAKDRRMMCKLYLLTADRALWRAAKRESNGGKYPLGRIRLAFGTESSYLSSAGRADGAAQNHTKRRAEEQT